MKLKEKQFMEAWRRWNLENLPARSVQAVADYLLAESEKSHAAEIAALTAKQEYPLENVLIEADPEPEPGMFRSYGELALFVLRIASSFAVGWLIAWAICAL